MKALCTYHMGKKLEAYDLVKLGLKYDLKSNVCWHVYGMLYRSDHNYIEACKCFKRALTFNSKDPDQQILKDLGLLQLQLRDVQNNIETRRQLLSVKSNVSMFWLGFATAHQYGGNNDMTLAVLERYESTLDPTRIPNTEDLEILFYQIEIMYSLGLYDQAIQLINKPWSKQALVDEVGLLEVKAKLYLAKGNKQEANKYYSELLHINPDNHEIHQQYLLTKEYHNLSMNNQQQINEFLTTYITLLRSHPRCRTLLWIILRCLPSSHSLYEIIARTYIRNTLRRGIPALYTELKQIYNIHHLINNNISIEESKSRQILFINIAKDYYTTALTTTFTVLPFADNDIQTLITTNNTITKDEIINFFGTATGDNKNEIPSTYPFCTLLYSKLLDAQKNYPESLQILHKGIEHSPTVLELYLTKGKILKHQKQFTEAATAIDEARQLDLADRYLNAKAVKYYLLANNIEQAETLMALFARHDSKRPNADPLSSIRDVQVAWFELQCGLAFERLGNYNRALKQYQRIIRLFETFFDDEYDYHYYCLRKGTLRSHASMMAQGDILRCHDYFLQASIGAARVYLALHRDTALLETLRKKAKEASDIATANKEAVLKNEKINTPVDEENDGPDNTGIDTDPEGLKHLEVTSCLDEAMKIIQTGLDNLCTPWQPTTRLFEETSMHTVPKVHTMVWSKPKERTPENMDKNIALDMYSVAIDITLEKNLYGAAAAASMKALSLGNTGATITAILDKHNTKITSSNSKGVTIIQGIKDFIKKL